MTDQGHGKDWRELCKAAATEEDPDKLMELVDAINKALAELHRKPCGGNSSSALYAS